MPGLLCCVAAARASACGGVGGAGAPREGQARLVRLHAVCFACYQVCDKTFVLLVLNSLCGFRGYNRTPGAVHALYALFGVQQGLNARNPLASGGNAGSA